MKSHHFINSRYLRVTGCYGNSMLKERAQQVPVTAKQMELYILERSENLDFFWWEWGGMLSLEFLL